MLALQTPVTFKSKVSLNHFCQRYNQISRVSGRYQIRVPEGHTLRLLTYIQIKRRKSLHELLLFNKGQIAIQTHVNNAPFIIKRAIAHPRTIKPLCLDTSYWWIPKKFTRLRLDKPPNIKLAKDLTRTWLSVSSITRNKDFGTPEIVIVQDFQSSTSIKRLGSLRVNDLKFGLMLLQ